MNIRIVPAENRKFWGCLRFPDCRGTANIEEPRLPVSDQWRDDTARMVLLAMIGNWKEFFVPTDPRSASEEAVQITDELIEALRKNGKQP